jgi:hypothetical protein
MMPSKRQKTVRERRQAHKAFEIPADSDAESSDEHDDSVFLPGRKSRRKGPSSSMPRGGKSARAKPNSKAKASRSAAADPGPGKKAKQSTSALTTTSAKEPPVLTPSTTSNRETKSPSQLRSFATTGTTTTSTSSNIDPSARADAEKPYGGSHHRRAGGPGNGGDKENQRAGNSEADEPAGQDADVRDNKPAARPVPKRRNKWADIDAWDMEFEEIEVISGSGGDSPSRR